MYRQVKRCVSVTLSSSYLIEFALLPECIRKGWHGKARSAISDEHDFLTIQPCVARRPALCYTFPEKYDEVEHSSPRGLFLRRATAWHKQGEAGRLTL